MGNKIPNKNILELIDKVMPLLKESGIPYWLGRGVLGDYLVNGELKCKHSDVDFHIWEKDKEILKQKIIPKFKGDGFDAISNETYKLAFRKPIDKPEYFLEFMYIFEDTNPEIVYHETYGEKRRCPKQCFSKAENKTIKINNHEIPIPSCMEEYFSQIYNDKEWRKRYIK